MQVDNSYRNSIYRFNIIYLFFMVLWPLFQRNFFDGIDGAGRIGWIMMFLAVLLNAGTLFRVPKAMFIWGLWIIYNIILSQIKGFHSENLSYPFWVINNLIKPFVTMLVAYQTFRMDTDRTTKSILHCWLIFVVIGVLTMKGNARNVGGEEIVRQANEMGNAFVNASIFLLTFAFCAYYKKIISKKIFLFACAIEAIAVIVSGSRKGLAAILIILFFSIIGRFSNVGKKKIILTGIISIVACFILQLVLQYTVAGHRFQVGIETSKYAGNWFLQLMGDRGFMYYYGWGLFVDNPLTGIGLTNFRWNNPVKSLAMHSEYMVQLCECGIIGTTLFLSFYSGMINRIKNLVFDPANRQATYPILATMLGVLLMNFFTWTYSNTWFFVFWGFVFAYYDNTKQSDTQTS